MMSPLMKKLLKQAYDVVPLKKELFSFTRHLWVPSERIYRHLHFKGVFEVRIDEEHAFRMRHYGFLIENEIFWKGLHAGFEKVSMSLWIKLLRHSNIVFDVGANTGLYSLVTKAIRPDARVFAFEPIQRVYTRLQGNNALNGYDIMCVKKAASNANGKAIVYDTPTEHVLSVTVGKNLNSPEKKVIPTEVETIRLDTFIKEQQLDRLDLMKLDVETHEPEVLEGLGEYLGRYHPTMLVEVLNDETGKRVEQIVDGLGYLYFNIDDEAGSVRRAERITKSDYYNYLLCDLNTARMLGLES